MRIGANCFVGSLLVLSACSSGSTGPSDGPSGGTVGAEGGNVGRGGSSSTSSGRGGFTNTGGTVLSLGGRASGGATVGGAGTERTGGAAGTDAPRGGSAAGGGARTTGGARATGGASPASGAAGRAGANVGGRVGTGGAAAPGGSAGTVGSCGENPGQLFGADHPWNQRIDQSPLDSESTAIIAYLQQNHTSSKRFRVDGPSDEPNNLYGITVLSADASTSHQSFTQTDDFYSPDCDPAPIPIPAAGAIEGETSYACTNDGDCHLIVIDRAECKLFEMWRANRTSTTSFHGGCSVVWDLRQQYHPELRGECCTSADAAGLP